MSKLYALTDGTYSNYHIETLTADKAKAERIRAVYGYLIEEYEDGELDDFLYSKNKYGVFYENGNLEAYNVWASAEPELNCVEREDFLDGYWVFVIAEDIEHAKKIGKDLIMQYIAQKQGL